MPFDQTYAVVVPDCSLEDLFKRIEKRLNDGPTLFSYEKPLLMELAAREIARSGDDRGKKFVCAEQRFFPSDKTCVGKIDAYFRESGFVPSAQAFMAAALAGDYCAVSQPMRSKEGGEFLMRMQFIPGSTIEEEKDCAIFATMTIEEMNRRLGWGHCLFRGFKLVE